MKKIIIVLLAVILALAAGTVAAEESELPGKPFEDFTATDTEGNVFTLSEALKDHEAVLINFWATWCPPCQNEMPHLQKLWETYGDRVAMIALSTEPIRRPGGDDCAVHRTGGYGGKDLRVPGRIRPHVPDGTG